MTNRDLIDIGLTDEQVDKVAGMVKKEIKAAVSEAEGKLEEANKEAETLKTASTETESIKAALEKLQKKYDTDIAAYKKQIAERDYASAITKALTDNGIQFSSKAARKAFISDLTAENLAVKDGDLVGFEDYYKAQLAADPDAFAQGGKVKEPERVADPKPPVFTRGMGAGNAPAPVKTRAAELVEEHMKTLYGKAE